MEGFRRELRPFLVSQVTGHGATEEPWQDGMFLPLVWVGHTCVFWLLPEPLSLELKIAKDGNTRTFFPLPRAGIQLPHLRGLQHGRFERQWFAERSLPAPRR